MNGHGPDDDGGADLPDLPDADQEPVASPFDDGQLVLLQRGLRLAELSTEQLWLRFFSLGGDTGLVEVQAHLAGLMPLPRLQRDMLAHAVNERLDELLLSGRVPYSNAEPVEPSRQSELSALVTLLAGAHLVPPDRLAGLAATAFRMLGADVTMYLVDHDQRRLVPATAGLAPGSSSHDRPALDIDSTPAGRAFRDTQTQTSDAREQPRLWLPLLDGTERLGVLEVELAATANVDDPVLRGQCRHLTDLLGHLVTTTGARGDALDAARRRRARTPAAELVSQLLPPPSGRTGSFEVSGWLEPADDAGGDAFDYALSHAGASLAVLDATGQGLPAGLLTAAALAAYRSARRGGLGLLGQACSIDQTLRALTPGGAFVTGLLAELDLASGELRYLSAGHPHPLLLRSGTVVSTLVGGRRSPFGLAGPAPPGDTDPGPGRTHDATGAEDPTVTAGPAPSGVGTQQLQAGDWLLIHTDGVTGARDAQGAVFGEARLIHALERSAAAGLPPQETARQLAHAVLQHRGGALQDDATVLLGCWLEP